MFYLVPTGAASDLVQLTAAASDARVAAAVGQAAPLLVFGILFL